VLTTLTRRVPRPSVALVVAFVALFAALGGTGYAALKVTGKNIDNGTVTGDDIKNKSLKEKELEPDTITGGRIKESTLGTVPSAQHAGSADSAGTAAKAADADKLGGLAATDFMRNIPRTFEANIPSQTNIADGSPLGTLTNLPAGTYLITARLGYFNPGAAGSEVCTLDVPGDNDAATFTPLTATSEQITLQDIVTSDSLFLATVHCTSDGSDDVSAGNILAVRLD
jgi:hypothetical protein